jgi:hypothetical protein
LMNNHVQVGANCGYSLQDGEQQRIHPSHG